MKRAAAEVRLDSARESERRFHLVQSAFEQARRGASELGGGVYHVCGRTVRLRIVGRRLASHIEPAAEHLRDTGAGAEPDLRVDLWDVRESGAAGLPAAESHAGGRTWELADGVFSVSGDRRFASHELRQSVAWLDRRGGHLVGWFADGGALSLHERGKPLQMLLALWASDRGIQAVHAALVARRGRGVLVPGASGSGKSTVALACLQAGYSYIGDDWVGVRRMTDGSFVGHGLFSSAYLEPAHVRRFPLLAAQAVAPPSSQETKSLVLLSRSFPGRLDASARICALALPRITTRRRSAVHPASKAQALLTLAPSSVFTLRPRLGREGAERLVELAQHVPAYWLEIGSDLDQIPQRIGEILAAPDPAAP